MQPLGALSFDMARVYLSLIHSSLHAQINKAAADGQRLDLASSIDHA